MVVDGESVPVGELHRLRKNRVDGGGVNQSRVQIQPEVRWKNAEGDREHGGAVVGRRAARLSFEAVRNPLGDLTGRPGLADCHTQPADRGRVAELPLSGEDWSQGRRRKSNHPSLAPPTHSQLITSSSSSAPASVNKHHLCGSQTNCSQHSVKESAGCVSSPISTSRMLLSPIRPPWACTSTIHSRPLGLGLGQHVGISAGTRWRSERRLDA